MCKHFVMKLLSLFLHNKNMRQSFGVKFLSLFYFYVCYKVKLNCVAWRLQVITEPLGCELEKVCFPLPGATVIVVTACSRTDKNGRKSRLT